MKLFTAEWCAPCRQIKHFLEGYHHSIEIIDVDIKPDATIAAGIRGVPTLLLGDGSVVTGIISIKEEITKAYGKTE